MSIGNKRVLDAELLVSNTFIICGRCIVTCSPDTLNCLSVAHLNFYNPVVFGAKLLVRNTFHECHCLSSCNDCLKVMPQLTTNTAHGEQLVSSTLKLSCSSVTSTLNCLSVAHLSMSRDIVTCSPDTLNCLSVAHLNSHSPAVFDAELLVSGTFIKPRKQGQRSATWQKVLGLVY